MLTAFVDHGTSHEDSSKFLRERGFDLNRPVTWKYSHESERWIVTQEESKRAATWATLNDHLGAAELA